MARHAFIVGGTGQVGRAVAEDLLGHGWRVTVAHRGHRPLPKELLGRGVAAILLDRDKPGALASALAQGADAVIDTTAYTPDHADQLLGIEDNVGAFVVISSASVYRDAKGRTLDEARQNGFPELPEPITEEQPTVDPGSATYSMQKMALERRLLDHSSRPVTVLRPCAIYGPGSRHPREWWLVKRILDRRPVIPLAYNGTSRFHTSATANIAALVRVALDRPRTRVLNIADPEALTVAEIASLIGKHLGYQGSFAGVADQEFPPDIGRTPWSVPRPFVVDNSAAADIGYSPVATYADAVGPMCDWLIETAGDGDWRDRFPLLARYSWDLFDYAEEDSLLAGAHRRNALILST